MKPGTEAQRSRPGAYDFGLTPDQEERAAQLHAESIIVDLLYWGPLGYGDYAPHLVKQLQDGFEGHRTPRRAFQDAFEIGGRLAAKGEMPEFRSSFEASGVTAGHYPLRIGSERALLESAAHLTRLVDALPWVRKVTSASDIIDAKANGELAYFGLCQPYEPITRDLTLLEQAYDLGLRVLTLTYNTHDLVGAGCTDRTEAGLSYFGQQVVELCNELGIVVDTAHSCRQTTLDACAISTTPVMATHTAAEAVHSHQRGKSDEELRAIAATGGVIGIVTVPPFLGPAEKATIESWLDHVDYMSDLVGWEHVAIGTDWPLMGPKWTMERCAEFFTEIGFREEHGLTDATHNMPGWDEYRDMPNITRGLVARGYRDEQVAGILGRNALRVFEAVLG